MNIFASDKAQELVNKCSMWGLMDKYYDAKKSYYNGNAALTDTEFDALESSIDAIHGIYLIREWGCIGYDINNHKAVKRLSDYFEKKLSEELLKNKVEPSNVNEFKVEEKKDVFEPRVIEKVINYKANEFGQLAMGF